jgi:hypothetical protein
MRLNKLDPVEIDATAAVLAIFVEPPREFLKCDYQSMRLITPAQISNAAINASVTAHPSIESANQRLFFKTPFSLLRESI